MTTLLRKVHIRQVAATYCAVFLLLVSTAEADKAEDSGALWNKVDQLIVDCDTAQSFGNDDQIKNAALVKLKVIHFLRYTVLRVTFLFSKQMYKLKGWAVVARPFFLL